LVKPNRTELAATVGRKLRDEAAVRAAMHELTMLGARRVVVTAGAEPALAFDRQDYWRIQGPRIDVVNQIGAGDAFTAGLVWRLLRGEDLGEACRWAAATGAADALTLLAGEVLRADVERLVGQVKVEKI
jgi:fructose-1-phosphate kinase PfkB-like protein